MQIVSEVMTRNVQFISPHESLQRAAQMMDELNVGALPVCDGERLIGMVTDRDITVRATAAGRAPGEAHVDEVMSTDVRWCFEDQSIDEVMHQMSDTQIRRVPVVSHDDAHRLVGIVSLGDLATKSGNAQKRNVEEALEKVSSPSEPDMPQQPGRRQQSASTGAGRPARTATGSDTGTATGFAGSDTLEAMGNETMADEDINAEVRAGAMGTAGASGAEGGRDTAGKRRADTAGITGNTGGTGAPGGTDAAGATGASGGTAGTAGSTGTGVGAKP